MLPLVLMIWGLIHIGITYGLWWVLALFVYWALPRPLDKIVLYLWAIIAYISTGGGCLFAAFVILALIDISTD